MAPNKFMTSLYKLWLKYNFKIYMSGDPNQCNPAEGGSQIHHNYLESILVREMCLKIETLEYRTNCGRYEKTYKALNFFLD